MSLPYDYERDDAKQRIRVRLQGQPQVEQFFAIIDRQADEGTWSFDILYDARRVCSPLGQDDADRVAAHVYRKLMTVGPRGAVAVVATAGDVIGAAQLYAFNTARAGVVVEVFWAMSEAESWLDGLADTRSET